MARLYVCVCMYFWVLMRVYKYIYFNVFVYVCTDKDAVRRRHVYKLPTRRACTHKKKTRTSKLFLVCAVFGLPPAVTGGEVKAPGRGLGGGWGGQGCGGFSLVRSAFVAIYLC